MLALLSVSLFLAFVNIVPSDVDTMRSVTVFDKMEECQQVVKENQICVNKGDNGAYLYQ